VYSMYFSVCINRFCKRYKVNLSQQFSLFRSPMNWHISRSNNFTFIASSNFVVSFGVFAKHFSSVSRTIMMDSCRSCSLDWNGRWLLVLGVSSLTRCSIFVRPDITREKRNREISIRHLLLLFSFTREWGLSGPERYGSCIQRSDLLDKDKLTKNVQCNKNNLSMYVEMSSEYCWMNPFLSPVGDYQDGGPWKRPLKVKQKNLRNNDGDKLPGHWETSIYILVRLNRFRYFPFIRHIGQRGWVVRTGNATFIHISIPFIDLYQTYEQ